MVEGADASEKIRQIVGFGGIERVGRHVGSFGAQAFGGAGQFRLVTACDDQLGARSRSQGGDGKADPRRTADDQNGLVLKLHEKRP